MKILLTGAAGGTAATNASMNAAIGAPHAFAQAWPAVLIVPSHCPDTLALVFT